MNRFLILSISIFLSNISYAQNTNSNNTTIVNGQGNTVVQNNYYIDNTSNSNATTNYTNSSGVDNTTNSSTMTVSTMHGVYKEDISKLSQALGKNQGYFNFKQSGAVTFYNGNTYKYGTYTISKSQREVIATVQWSGDSYTETIIIARFGKHFNYDGRIFKESSF